MPSGTGGRSPIDAAAVPGPPEPVAVPARPVPTPAELPWPVRGQVVAEPGWRRHPSFGNWRFEPWIRLTAAPGEPVRAVLPGTVTEAGRDPEGGVRIIVDHGSGLVTVYGNLGHGLVVPGQRVSGSAAVGLAAHDVGATVYFAVYQDGEAVDPRALLAPQ
ncbi:MAG: M23 family metallopeptidase [Firmicutes bacterium]|nr:M23 family metallopeptidase [Bacillota bacterium]